MCAYMCAKKINRNLSSKKTFQPSSNTCNTHACVAALGVTINGFLSNRDTRRQVITRHWLFSQSGSCWQVMTTFSRAGSSEHNTLNLQDVSICPSSIKLPYVKLWASYLRYKVTIMTCWASWLVRKLFPQLPVALHVRGRFPISLLWGVGVLTSEK